MNLFVVFFSHYFQPGQHARELNPYWKDGGVGLPQDIAASSKPVTAPVTSAPKVAGDGGLMWIRKAVDRCLEQAKETGVSVEEIAADRYGVSIKGFCNFLFNFIDS